MNISTFTLTLSLNPSISDISALNKLFELSRKLYNALLHESMKRLRLMRQSREYITIKNIPKNEQSRAYIAVKEKFGFTKNHMIKYSTGLRINEYNQVDSNTAQKLAQRAFSATEKLMYGNAKLVHFKRKGKMDSVEGSSNRQGIKYRDGKLIWNKLKIPVTIKERDTYAYEALKNKIKYCRIIRKKIRGELRYFLQLILQGIPPRKIDEETGMFKSRHGHGRVGIDIGTRTIAISSKKEVKLLELSPEVENIDKQKRLIQRKMERSKRTMNPRKFNENGTIKQTKEKWIWSNNYIKLSNELKELYRKQTVIRKQSHYKLVNWIVSLGNEFYVEKMNYNELRSKTHKKGTNKNKKRFGKSIQGKSPSMLLMLLKQKLGFWELELNEVDTFSFRASQYNHFTEQYIKKDLSERWNDFGEFKIQRDLYSAFLLMNSNSDLKKPNRDLCFRHWETFKELHDIEIKRLKDSAKVISSMGI